ncbi:M23 family metallopeptidase [Nocardioides agariphilus]|uniref:M23 family metallopeptidase n=1 Tax=Nocardioides agariphilus TaxID=433664 RepID=A0A930VS46_9ACTN|nr:M23 family metallopeptidase [Nocardioides agariphilus]MBF4769988.1 M23 family metallopeptidase [Nocardioides agariphilus]
MNAPRRRSPLVLLVSVMASALLTSPAAADTEPVGVWPLQPRPEVVRGFDPPEVAWGSGHRGVDLLGHLGQRVHAALPGTVTFAGMLAGRGVVVLSHGETRTTYEPVSASVRVGTSVGQGEVLGRLTYFGSHCLPRTCLHWGWLRGRTYLDPLDLVGAGPVRLLPLWRGQPVASSMARSSASVLARANPYQAILDQLSRLTRWSPDLAQARGCACW